MKLNNGSKVSTDERMSQTISEMKKRVNMCLEQNGEDFQHLL